MQGRRKQRNRRVNRNEDHVDAAARHLLRRLQLLHPHLLLLHLRRLLRRQLRS
jgi:hypothetical protein